MEYQVGKAAREALRQRLGAGARYDADAAPARDLAWARLGTAYFARKLNELSDEALDGASLLEGWTRRHVVALVGYQARALALQVEAARTGDAAPPMSEAALSGQIELGATLPSRALRNLFDHTEVHLNVEWRDLTDAGWERSVPVDGGRLPVRRTARMRARAIWVHAVDLDNGGSFFDFPPDLLDGLLADLAEAWARRAADVATLLVPDDRPSPVILDSAAGPRVSGATADLVRWLTGRGARRLTCSADQLPNLPCGGLMPPLSPCSADGIPCPAAPESHEDKR
jgi:maleylpyruvate isomerase